MESRPNVELQLVKIIFYKPIITFLSRLLYTQQILPARLKTRLNSRNVSSRCSFCTLAYSFPVTSQVIPHTGTGVLESVIYFLNTNYIFR